MGFRWRAVLGAVTCLMLVTSCGAGGPGTSSASPTSTSLPLQGKGLAVGGDVQSRATDVVSVRLTEEQTEELVEACRKVVDVASTSDGCGGALEETLDRVIRVKKLCRKFDLCVKVRAYGDPDMKTLGDGGYVEIVDQRKGKSLCDSDPSQVCLRVGIRSSATLRKIARPKSSPTSPSTSTPTPTPSPTTTSPSTSTPTQTGISPASPSADESPAAASSPSSSASSSA